MPSAPITAVFVYGTLKRGQCRQTCWPCDPLEVRRAWTRGQLYDTGPYPALFSGDDPVAGELWRFDAAVMAIVLAELDQVEEFTPGAEATNLYNRIVLPCTDRQGTVHEAYAYVYAREIERRFFNYIQPDYRPDTQSDYWPADLRLALWPPEGDW